MKLLKMKFPTKLQNNKTISEIEKSITEKVQAEEKHLCCLNSLNSSESTVSVVEQSESQKNSSEKEVDICPEFVTQKSETVLDQNSAIELHCSVAVAEGLQVEIKNKMDSLLKDIDCLQKGENLEFEKKSPQEEQKESMTPMMLADYQLVLLVTVLIVIHQLC